jgi:hypothetical protein
MVAGKSDQLAVWRRPVQAAADVLFAVFLQRLEVRCDPGPALSNSEIPGGHTLRGSTESPILPGEATRADSCYDISGRAQS